MSLSIAPTVIKAPIIDEKSREKVPTEVEGTNSRIDISKAQEFIQNLAKKFGAFSVYKNKNVEVEIEFTGTGARKSAHTQSSRTKDVSGLANVIALLPDIVQGAVPVETHQDLKSKHLKRVYVLLSAYIDGNKTIPVQMEVKEYNDENIKPKLYVVVTLAKEKTGVRDTTAHKEIPVASRPALSIRLSDVVSKVNIYDGDFLMYIPDGMLTNEQKRAKWEAVDERYQEAINTKKDY